MAAFERRQVAERRVPPVRVAVALDVVEDRDPRLVAALEPVTVHAFLLDRHHPAGTGGTASLVCGTPHRHLGVRTEAAGDNSLAPHHPSLTWKTERVESIHRSWNQRWGLGEAAAARAAH